MTMMQRSQRGATLVEFAMVVPIVIMLIVGAVEFGGATSAKATVTHAAREGVREYSLTQDASKGQSAARAAAPTLSSGSLTVSSSGCGDISDFGNEARTVVSYPYEISIPFVSMGVINLTSRGVMRCGG